MSGLVVPQVVYGLTNEELAELVAKALKEIDWAFNGNISDQNISIIAGYRASVTELKHKSGIVGMSGFDAANALAVRFWAGHANKSIAPFRVLQNGKIYATDGEFTGVIEALSGHIGGFTIEADKLSSDSGNGIIQGGTIIGAFIKTAETGARIELTEGVLKGYSEDNNLHGLVFSPSLTSNFFDLFIYHDGAKLLEFIDNGLSVIIRGTSDSVGMILGGAAAPTFGVGTWSFSGNASFINVINGSITGNAASADYADFAGTAAFADDLAPSGNIAWGQVLKSGSNLDDLDTKNISSLTEDSTHRTVTDAEKSTWNGKASKTLPSWTTITLSNGWGVFNGETPQYYKDEMGRMWFRGRISGGTTTDATTIFTLPVGDRPGVFTVIETTSSNGTTRSNAEITVNTTGEVNIYYASNTYLNIGAISFRSEL